MKVLFVLLLPTLLWANSAFDFDLNPSRGGKAKLAEFKAKAYLAVNIATQCGYTPQLDKLQKLSDKYKDKGLVVIGFPSNDFGGQTPESDKDVAKFCKLNYGVTFPLYKKGPVSGESKQKLYSYLTSNAPDKGEVKWNFEKFLLNSKGEVVQRYRSGVNPMSEAVTEEVEKLLKK
jgi:glutathione peroxidase